MSCPEGLTLFRVFRAGVSGWQLVCAKDADRAVKKRKNATAARPARPSSYYQQLREQGLYPVPKRRRTRRG